MSLNIAHVLLSIGPALEVSAYPKPGNVHRLRDFEDTRFEDFIITSHILAYVLRLGIVRGMRCSFTRVTVGDLIYRAVKMSKDIHGGGNTCLGTATLLTPISLAIGFRRSIEEIKNILTTATNIVREYSSVLDTIYFYKAIRYVKPSYLKRTDDTKGYPNVYSRNYILEIKRSNLRFYKLLSESSRFDIVSKEVVKGYPITQEALEFLESKLREGIDWNYAVIDTYLYLLSKYDDTLVIRKFGFNTMKFIARRAEDILRSGGSSSSEGYKQLIKLDKLLGSKGINPGAIADIVATTISLYSLKTRRSIIRMREGLESS